MDRSQLRERITDQFSYRGDRADVWRGFDRLLDTDAYLNLGYSPWYLPHVVGSSQERLAERVGATLAESLGDAQYVGRPLFDGRCGSSDDALPETPRVLDVGCGRGGPAIHLAERFGLDVLGVDLVPYNVRTAAENARSSTGHVAFVVGDASALPVAPGSVDACTAMDALVYVPDRGAVLSELARAVTADGVVVCSDLVRSDHATDAGRDAVARFADAWDMAEPATVREYEQWLDDAGLATRSAEDLTANSVGRFRTWTSLFLGLVESPAQPLVERSLRAMELEPTAVVEQIRRAHDALPYLRHVLFVGQKR